MVIVLQLVERYLFFEIIFLFFLAPLANYLSTHITYLAFRRNMYIIMHLIFVRVNKMVHVLFSIHSIELAGSISFKISLHLLGQALNGCQILS